MKRIAIVPLVLTFGCSVLVDPGQFQGGTLGASDAAVDGTVDAAVDGPSDAGTDGQTVPVDPSGCEGIGFTCRSAAPPGWSGPIVLVSGAGDATAPTCPGSAPSTVFVARSGWSAPPAECGCACAAPSPSQMSCGVASLRTSASACGGTGSHHTGVSTDECKSITALPSTGSWSASIPSLNATGTCAPQPSIDRAPAVWAGAHRACSAGPPVACNGGTCAPPLEDGQRLCVYVDDEVSCPAGFSERLLTAEDIRDERTCSECTCGSITGACSGQLHIANGCTAAATLHASIPLGGCITARSVTGTHHVRGGFSPIGSCRPGGVSPTGGLAPLGLRTVCCASP